MVSVSKRKVIDHWPFPSECPPKPWTPQEQRDYEQQQRDKVPDAPMIGVFL